MIFTCLLYLVQIASYQMFLPLLTIIFFAGVVCCQKCGISDFTVSESKYVRVHNSKKSSTVVSSAEEAIRSGANIVYAKLSGPKSSGASAIKVTKLVLLDATSNTPASKHTHQQARPPAGMPSSAPTTK